MVITSQFSQREDRIIAIVEAIELFVEAKATYDRTYATGVDYVNPAELDNARDNLQETLENCL